jgi:hypothetical protein
MTFHSVGRAYDNFLNGGASEPSCDEQPPGLISWKQAVLMPPDAGSDSGPRSASKLRSRFEVVKVIEAKFYPFSKAQGAGVSVGRVSCIGAGAIVDLVEVEKEKVAPFDPSDLTRELQVRIRSAHPNIFEKLLQTRSEYWEFVEIVGQ